MLGYCNEDDKLKDLESRVFELEKQKAITFFNNAEEIQDNNVLFVHDGKLKFRDVNGVMHNVTLNI